MPVCAKTRLAIVPQRRILNDLLMKWVAGLLWGIFGISLLLTSAVAAQFKVAWQRTNNFESVSFDGLDRPIVKVDGRGNVYVAAVDGRVVGQGVIHDYVVVKRNA